MTDTSMPDEQAVTIVGSGVHGVHLAIRLLSDDVVSRDRLCLVDPSGLLASFRRKSRACGMASLRSPFVHQLDADPFSLRDFAQKHGREDELVASEDGADRPTTELFFDHADRLCEQHGLESLRVDAAVTGLSDHGAHVRVETTAGSFSSAWCVLAVGYGGSYSMPAWADGLPSSAPVAHVWDGCFEPSAVGDSERLGIIGSGVTGVQLAASLACPERDVVVFARSPFRTQRREAGTDWMHFSDALEALHSYPPASRGRERVVADARYDGSVPPYAMARFRRAVDRGWITVEATEVVDATAAGGTVVVTCRDGRADWFDRLICATGFGTPYEGTLLSRLRNETSLATGYLGAPALDDDSLRWRRADGTRSRVAVSGAAAQQVLGPFARNIVGARQAGNILADVIEVEPAAPPAIRG